VVVACGAPDVQALSSNVRLLSFKASSLPARKGYQTIKRRPGRALDLQRNQTHGGQRVECLTWATTGPLGLLVLGPTYLVPFKSLHHLEVVVLHSKSTHPKSHMPKTPNVDRRLSQ